MKLLVCIGPRCDAEGRGSALLARLRAALAERFAAEVAAGTLKCETRDCLRLCTRDPIVRLEPSGEAFSNPDIDALLAALRVELASQTTGSDARRSAKRPC